MFRKQQGNGIKVLQGNKDRLMRRGLLTRKHSNMRNTFKIQMEKNCFLTIKASCSPESECKSCWDSLIICLFVNAFFQCVLYFFGCSFTILCWESVKNILAWFSIAVHLGSYCRSLRLQHYVEMAHTTILDLCNYSPSLSHNFCSFGHNNVGTMVYKYGNQKVWQHL